MRIEVHDTIADLDAAAWDELNAGRFPFLQHAFLERAEATGCVSSDTGWTPCHLGAYDRSGKLTAAMPLYEKSHSWGEFVFDWSWAQAYERAGLDYYPKLVSAVPFTPAPRSAVLAKNGADAAAILTFATDFARNNGYSSLHVLFPEFADLPALQDAGLLLRKDCQFHWQNRDYNDFEDFLAQFSSAKRKKARRDRRHVVESGVRYRWHDGAEMSHSQWSAVYRLLSYTFMRRGSMPYFDLQFFEQVSRKLPGQILVAAAELDSTIVAAAVFFRGSDTLYGRYWGCDRHINALHFETCYYQGIDYCIRHGLQRFEPGTQGEHKISRGFSPVATWSAHWLARPDFFDAIERYVGEEQNYIDDYMDAVDAHSPYKHEDAVK